ncbi:MAG: Mrp/NBP35 family ATP-binding protein, partial [Pseudomonadota bacterium]
AVLSGLIDPDSQKPLGNSGRIADISVREDGRATVILHTQAPPTDADTALRVQAEAVVDAVPGVASAQILMTAHSNAPMNAPPNATPNAPAPRAGERRLQKGDNIAAQDAKPPQGAAQARSGIELPGVGAVVAVASAKGGVGKSTIAVNLAVACAQLGLKTGLLDIDVYGPSAPTMLGTQSVKPEADASKKLRPVEAHGLKTMSIGYLADQDAPMVWRGPIVMSAITQMLSDVAWAPLDILFIDTPPGTGDAQLTLAQRAPLSGAIIVSTPQEVALADVRRGVAMFRKTAVPVLGVIENMAYFEDPASGARTHIFGEGGARRTAEALEAPFLGEIPLETVLREGGDAGAPAATTHPGCAKLFQAIAEKILAQLAAPQGKPAPEIAFT